MSTQRRIGFLHLVAVFAIQWAVGYASWHGLGDFLDERVTGHLGGFINSTLLVSGATLLACAGIFVGYFGLRFADLGLGGNQLLPAMVALAGGWVAIQFVCGSAALVGYPVALASPELPWSVAIGDLLGELLGSTLLEEFVFRGLLFPQLAILLQPRFRRLSVPLAIGVSQAAFAAVHVPAFLARSGTVSPLYFGAAFGVGVLFCLLLRSGKNLWLCVALHTLFNWGDLQLVRSPIAPAVGAWCVLIVVTFVVYRRSIARRAPIL